MRTAATIPVVAAILTAAGSGSLAAICTPSPTVLCLNGFAVEVTWMDDSGSVPTPRDGLPLPISLDDTGFFRFTDARYVEVFVQVLDGCRINNHFWVFAASLTDVEYTLTVTDPESTASYTHTNPAGERTVVTDTSALDACPSPSTARAPAPRGQAAGLASPTATRDASRGPEAAVLAPCVADATTLCLVGDRFRVELTWTDFGSTTGDGAPFPLTSHSGAFAFFTPANLDVVTKIVDTCPAFEVHLGGTTNVEYTLTVTDTRTGQTWSHLNPLGNVSAVGDATAFPRSCLFGDGFESGDTAAWFLP